VGGGMLEGKNGVRGPLFPFFQRSGPFLFIHPLIPSKKLHFCASRYVLSMEFSQNNKTTQETCIISDNNVLDWTALPLMLDKLANFASRRWLYISPTYFGHNNSRSLTIPLGGTIILKRFMCVLVWSHRLLGPEDHVNVQGNGLKMGRLVGVGKGALENKL
jgi:hypothetical protein